MQGIRQAARCGRAIVMVALAYLFVLQAVLAPAALLVASAAQAAGMPLCDDPAMAVPSSGSGHDHATCCDLGCLPHKAGLALLAVPPPAGGLLPARLEAGRAELGREPERGPAAAPGPGLPGARAPPSPIA